MAYSWVLEEDVPPSPDTLRRVHRQSSRGRGLHAVEAPQLTGASEDIRRGHTRKKYITYYYSYYIPR